MPIEKILPSLLCAIDVCAALVYLIATDDWRKVAYWFAAGILTYVVTW